MVADVAQPECNNNKCYASAFKYIYIYVRTRFGSLTQKVDGLKTKKPKTMNL